MSKPEDVEICRCVDLYSCLEEKILLAVGHKKDTLKIFIVIYRGKTNHHHRELQKEGTIYRSKQIRDFWTFADSLNNFWDFPSTFIELDIDVEKATDVSDATSVSVVPQYLVEYGLSLPIELVQSLRNSENDRTTVLGVEVFVSRERDVLLCMVKYVTLVI